MPGRLVGEESAGDASSGSRREESAERVLCLFDAVDSVDRRFVRVAATLADGGRFVVPVEGPDAARSLNPNAVDAQADYETSFLARPQRMNPAWVTDVVNRFDITTIFDIRDRDSVLAGGEPASTTGSDYVTVTPGTEVGSLSSCLVPVTRGPHLDETLDIARTVGEAQDAWLDLFHVVEEGGPTGESDALFEYCADRLGDFEEFDTWEYEGWTPAQAIVDQSSYYDATILSAPRKGRLREFVDGSTTEVVQSLCENAVVTVRSGDVDESRLDRWLGEFLTPGR